MSFFSTLKGNAKHAIRDYRGRACLILLINLAVGLLWGSFLFVASIGISEGIISFGGTADRQLYIQREQFFIVLGIQIAAMLFSVFLLNPLTLGIVGWYMGVVNAKVQSVGSIFVFFESPRRYWRSVAYSINMAVRTMFWAILFFILPISVLAGAVLFSEMYGTGGGRQFAIISAFGMILAIMLVLLATLLYSAYMSKYFLVAYMLASDEEITVRNAFKQSAQHTIGHRFSILWYSFSLIGWMLLTALFLPLIFLTAPYLSTAFAMYANYLIEKSHAAKNPARENWEELPDITREFSGAKQAPVHPILQSDDDDLTPTEPAALSPELEWHEAGGIFERDFTPEPPPATDESTPYPAFEATTPYPNPSTNPLPDTPQETIQFPQEPDPNYPTDPNPTNPPRWPYV